MVQYVFTPWRDSAELSRVKKAFFPHKGTNTETITNEEDINNMDDAVDRVAMWMVRGNCPHMIESTALLTAAIVQDGRKGGSEYATRAAYSTAFSRFVTGLLDSQQDKLHKMSMFTLAKNIGLPATFVELRHQATHEELPSLVRLRKVAREGLVWIWGYYWVHVEDVNEEQKHKEEKEKMNVNMMEGKVSEEIITEVLAFLGSEEAADGQQRRDVAEIWVSRWGGRTVEVAISRVEAEAGERRVMLRAMQVMREVEEVRDSLLEEISAETVKLEEMDVEVDENEDGDDVGWSIWEGKWKGRPIGVV